MLPIVAALSVAFAGPWTTDPARVNEAANLRAHPRSLKRYMINLDLPATERWNAIATDFVDQAKAVHEYLASNVPNWSLPLLEHVAAKVVDYFGEDGQEMRGVAKALEMDLGDIVLLNLIMQVESIGLK